MIKNITTILGVLAAVASLSLADSAPEASAQDTKKMVQNNFVETAQKGIKLSGYVDSGYSYNFAGSGNQSSITGRFGGDSAQRGDFNLYAVKVAIEKALTSENKAQAGFRTDIMLGEDATYFLNRTAGATTNVDNNSNSLFLEQAYVEIRAPVGNGWDFKVGKFVSVLGYEVMERPANMNTTFGLLFNLMPLYYTGVFSSYKFDDYIDMKLGVVNGSNSDNNTTLNPDAGDGCAVIASLDFIAPSGNATWSNNIQYSTGNDNNTSVSSTNTSQNSEAGVTPPGISVSSFLFLYNSWGNWAPTFSAGKLLLAFDTLLGQATGSSTYPSNVNTCRYGAALYAKYQFNNWFYLAGRGETIGSNNAGAFGNHGSTTTAAGHVTGNNIWEYTLTAGFNVIDNLLVRAEYRIDWGSNIYNTVSGNQNGSASGGPVYYAGAEVVYSF